MMMGGGRETYEENITFFLFVSNDSSCDCLKAGLVAIVMGMEGEMDLHCGLT